MSTTRMPRKRFLTRFMFHRKALTCHAEITFRSSVTEKTRPRPPKISRWSLRSMISHSTQFTERSLLVVRGFCHCSLVRTHFPQGADGTVNFWDKDARTRLKGEASTLNNLFQCLTFLHRDSLRPVAWPDCRNRF